MPSSFTLSLVILSLLLVPRCIHALDFTWPANTVQCGIVPMNITGGSPPYEFTIVPIDGQVFSWNLIEPVSGKWINETWNVQVQMPAGTAYVVYLSHSGSFGQGGITPIQVVGSSTDTLCLATAASNASTNLFSMDLAGLPAPSECDTSLRIKHDGSAASAPYNYTIVPLDGGYKPWSAAFPDGVNELDVGVNMTSGSRFSVFLSSRIGFGGAQTGKIYTVNQTRSNSITCEAQPYVVPSGYVWPSSLLSTTLPVANDYNASSSVASSTATGSSPIGSASSTPTGDSGSGESKGLSTGAMAGIGAGIGCLALAGVGVLLWWFLRRRKAEKARGEGGYQSGEKRFDMLSPPKQIDSYGPDKGVGLGDGANGNDPRVEPFRSHSEYARASLPVQGYAGGLGAPEQTHPHSPGPSTDGGQTDYVTSDPMLAHASQAFPIPQPSGDLSLAPSESDGLSRGPTGTAFYYIPPSGSMGVTSGSAVDIARGSSHASAGPQGASAETGQDPQPVLLPPGTMIRGPVSAASEKARLSAQYAQMENQGGSDVALASGSPGKAPSPSPSFSPLTPPGRHATDPLPLGQPYLPHRVESPAQAVQARVITVSPVSAIESHHGHVQATSQVEQHQIQGQGQEHGLQVTAMPSYHRHVDGGELQDENRPDVGQVDLPPLYEDVPARET